MRFFKDKYQLEQKLQIHGLPPESADAHLNGTIVVVVARKGQFHKQLPVAYGILLPSGAVIGGIEKYLRPAPNVPPTSRGDLDRPTSWDEFDTATGINSTTFRDGFNPNRDY
jgi:hypothetical protein